MGQQSALFFPSGEELPAPGDQMRAVDAGADVLAAEADGTGLSGVCLEGVLEDQSVIRYGGDENKICNSL
jgi:hypothetical protein